MNGTTRVEKEAWAISPALRCAEFRNTSLKADLSERGFREVPVTLDAGMVTAVLQRDILTKRGEW